MPLIPPFAITASYQKEQMATGTYTQGGSQVFSHLVSPPTSGVAAETSADSHAHAVGFSAYSAQAEVQVITINGAPTGGTFTLTWGDGTTTPLAYNASSTAVQSALRAIMPAAYGAVNEVQTVTVTGAPTGGTFTLTYSGQTTAGIAYNAAASAVQTALQALSTVGANNATVTGTPGNYTVTFTGALAGTDVSQMTASGAGLTGGTSPGVTVATQTPGVAATQNVTVAGANGGPYTVTFAGHLANIDVAQIVGDATGLTGGTKPSVTVTTTTGGQGAFVNQALQNAHQQYDPMRNFYDSASGNHF
jgi:hypothetical protein